MGIETRPRVAAMAVRALHDEAEVRTGDIRVHGVPPADVVLLFDVLHMVPAEDQAALLRAVHDALPAGGRLYVREADASAGWRFTMVRLGNRLKALATRNWRQTFAFRTPADWLTLLEATGFAAEVVPMGAGTPFGNVLLLATRRG